MKETRRRSSDWWRRRQRARSENPRVSASAAAVRSAAGVHSAIDGLTWDGGEISRSSEEDMKKRPQPEASQRADSRVTAM